MVGTTAAAATAPPSGDRIDLVAGGEDPGGAGVDLASSTTAALLDGLATACKGEGQGRASAREGEDGGGGGAAGEAVVSNGGGGGGGQWCRRRRKVWLFFYFL
ncbi:hypothetical protein PVAP13_2NG262112 [Panicum virgatum]|uniref:Uncharacterized protein n=1 Tax=Panicum virgatum TaxID=38727 RepID=A0A8T0VFT5_PANVG|nr:hypothetical protein PVAP13_2NG262112 [Panicum virgatum]